MLVVRRFDNADLPTVVRLWNLHHQENGLAFPISMQQFQSCVLDRITHPDHRILLGEVGDHPVGFIHFGTTSAHSNSSSDLSVLALCIEPSALAAQAAQQLIGQADSAGVRIAGVTLRDRAGYVGLTPLSGLVGIADLDVRSVQWFHSAGWRPTEKWGVWQLSLPTFRVPVDRRLSTLRRNTSITETDRIAGDFAAENGWGHLDPLQFELRERSGKALARITAWHAGYGDAISGSEVIMTDLSMLPGAPDGSDLQLVTEVMRDLATRRFLAVKVAIRMDQTVEQSFWQTVGFRNLGTGAVYNKVAL